MKMKCYLCGFKNDNAAKVKKHYIDFHKVDLNNQFFKSLFNDSQNNFSRTGQCVRCKEFLPTNSYRKRHNFLKHYDAGSSAAAALAEEKPISISKIGPIKVYEIRFENHSPDYDFFEFEQLVDEFLSNVKRRIARSANDYLIRCDFSLQNVQPSPEGFDQPLTATRYWSTDPISTKFFNNFVLFHIRDTILKRIIVTGLTGSSW